MTLPSRAPRRRAQLRQAELGGEMAEHLEAAEADRIDERGELAAWRALMVDPGWAGLCRVIDRRIERHQQTMEVLGADPRLRDTAAGAIDALRFVRRFPVERSKDLADKLERATPAPATDEDIRARGGPRA